MAERRTSSDPWPGAAAYGPLMCCVVLTADGQTTTATGIPELKGLSDPVPIAEHYRRGGAEVMFVDIGDTWEHVASIRRHVQRLAATGLGLVMSIDNGAIGSPDDVRYILDAGAQAVTVNTVAVDDPERVRTAAAELGGARLVGVVNVTTDPDGRSKKRQKKKHT